MYAIHYYYYYYYYILYGTEYYDLYTLRLFARAFIESTRTLRYDTVPYTYALSLRFTRWLYP